MRIYPAIDLRNGKCVRLTEGRFDKETVFADDPAEMAVKWAKAGAEYLHVVDLDGAVAGESKNLEVIKKIVSAVDIPVQVGGGIRSMQNIEQMLAIGVKRVILGSAAVKNPDLVREACLKYPDRIVVGIDAKDGYAAINGWENKSAVTAVDLACSMADLGVKTIIFTDISKDGTLSGVNVQATAELAKRSGLEIIASGGVSSLSDIEALLKYESCGIGGCIVGKAIYTGKIFLADAIKLAGGE